MVRNSSYSDWDGGKSRERKADKMWSDFYNEFVETMTDYEMASWTSFTLIRTTKVNHDESG